MMTEFNEQGCEVSKVALERLYTTLEKHLDDSSILVLNGSVPRGVPEDIYGEIIKKAKEKGIKTILDAANQLLIEGIKEKPYLIKPNKDEFEEAFGKKITSIENAVTFAREIISQGIRYVCLSMGDEGALLVSKENAYLAPPLKLDIKGVQGAGDSLVAGMCIAINQGLSDEELLKYGVATASGSLIHEGTLLCNPEDFASMYKQIIIQKIGGKEDEEKSN
jgi:1-phosphofructokinase